jgi:hypothetical protein
MVGSAKTWAIGNATYSPRQLEHKIPIRLNIFIRVVTPHLRSRNISACKDFIATNSKVFFCVLCYRSLNFPSFLGKELATQRTMKVRKFLGNEKS